MSLLIRANYLVTLEPWECGLMVMVNGGIVVWLKLKKILSTKVYVPCSCPCPCQDLNRSILIRVREGPPDSDFPFQQNALYYSGESESRVVIKF